MPKPTLRQVVESGYGWANGDIEPRKLETESRYDATTADGLIQFLLSETKPDGVAPNSAEHFAQARQRVAQAQYELSTVYHALCIHEPAN